MRYAQVSSGMKNDYELPVMYEDLTPKQRYEVREQYAEEQGEDCWYCGWPLDGEPAEVVQEARINLRLFPPGFLTRPVHLQHDHVTGLTEGAVHAKCNAYLWQYEGR